MIVIDASLVTEMVLSSPRGRRVAKEIEQQSVSLAAPDVLKLEVLQTLRRLAYRDAVTQSEADRAVALMFDLPIELYPHEDIIRRIWSLRHNFTAYDASYVALAELLQTDFWTGDRKFKALPGMDIQILTY